MVQALVLALVNRARSISRTCGDTPFPPAKPLAYNRLLALASLAARPLAWGLARIGPAGSPGAVGLAWSVLVAVGLTRYYNAHETWLRALEWSAIKVFAAMACAAAEMPRQWRAKEASTAGLTPAQCRSMPDSSAETSSAPPGDDALTMSSSAAGVSVDARLGKSKCKTRPTCACARGECWSVA